MQAIPQKRSVAIHFAKPLAAYIKTAYQRDPTTLSTELNEFDELRAASISAVANKSSLLTLIRYLSQLRRLPSRFPIGNENGIKITFSWFNFAGKEKKPVASFNLHLEEAAILFNLGSMYSILGAEESLNTSEGLKRACNHFLLAAGVYEALIRDYPVMNLGLPIGSGVDVADENILNCLQQLMLAQAQECFVLKAILEGNVKEGTLAKLASSTAAFYEVAIRHADSSNVGIVSGDWLEIMKAKAAIYRATAHYRKASEFLASQSYGREIVKLQEAEEALRPALELQKRISSSLPALANLLSNTSLTIQKNLERALKENQLIYHEILPPRGPWGDCSAAVVVRPATFPDAALKTELEDTPFLFERLPPLAISQTTDLCVQLRDIKRMEAENHVNSISQLLETTIDKLNISTVLETLEHAPRGIPESLRQKSAAIKASGGIITLEKKRESAQELRRQCLNRHQGLKELLEAEQKEDGESRQRFGACWTRPPSAQLNALLRQRLDELGDLLMKSEATDQQIASSYEQHLPSILVLTSEGEEELETAIPSSSTRTLGYDESLMEELKILLERKSELEGRQRQLLTELTEQLALLDPVGIAFANEGDLEKSRNEFTETMDRQLQAWNESVKSWESEVTEFCRMIERLMNEFWNSASPAIVSTFSSVTGSNDSLIPSHLASASSTSPVESRQEVIQRLEQGHDVYNTLLNSWQGAIDFYTLLLLQLEQELRSMIEDWVGNRRREAEMLIANMSTPHTMPTAPTASAPWGYQPRPQSSTYPANIRPGAWNPSMPIQYAPMPPPSTIPSTHYPQPPPPPPSQYYQQPYQSGPYQSGPYPPPMPGTTYPSQQPPPTMGNYYAPASPTTNIPPPHPTGTYPSNYYHQHNRGPQ